MVADVARYIYPLTEPRSRRVAMLQANRGVAELHRHGRLVECGYRHWVQPGYGRMLRNGREVKVLKKPVDLVLRTCVPGKWAALDLETGELWSPGATRKWVRMTERARSEVLEVLGAGDKKGG